MEIFFCTFIIKLHYVKRLKESQLKGSYFTFQAIIKSSKNHIIASGSSKPSLMNDTAWFNERFEINSDLLLNPQTKGFNQSVITLEIKAVSKYSSNSYTKSFNLADIAERKNISEKEYSLSSGLLASVQLSCTNIESKGIKPLRKRQNSLQKNEKKEYEPPTFLMLQKVSFAPQAEKEASHGTPQFNQKSFRSIDESMLDEHPLELEDPRPQLNGLREQFNKQIQEHDQTKKKLKSVKQLLENEYNVNRQQKIAISTLKKQLQSKKQSTKSLEIQLSETENLCNALSATLNNKQTQLIQLGSFIQQYKQRLATLHKRLEAIDPLERAKATLEWQNRVLKKQVQNLKINLNKQYLSEDSVTKQLEQLKIQHTNLKASKEKIQDALDKALKREKESVSIIVRLTQEKDQIKSQTTKWRSEFAVQSQHKDEEINNLQDHYSQLFNRYEEILKKTENFQKTVAKEVFDNTIKDFQKKLEQKEQKQSKLRQQLDIIEQQISNLQQLLEQKEENQQILLAHIKKLQKDLEQYAINDNWWNSILDKNQSQTSNGSTDERTKLINKNQQLIQLLQKNSKTILQGEKLKNDLNNFKKQNEQLLQKELVLTEQHKELKDKIASLYKQNKKLQQKNSKLMKENEFINKKNTWLEDEITQSKNSEKEARQDYQLISFQLSKIKKSHEYKQKHKKENTPLLLSVISQNSEEFIPSSHHLIKENSLFKQKPNSLGTIDNTVVVQLGKLLQQRMLTVQQMKSHLQGLQTKNQREVYEQLKKHLKRLTISNSKIKASLVRSGNRQCVRQWQAALSSLSSILELFASNKK